MKLTFKPVLMKTLAFTQSSATAVKRGVLTVFTTAAIAMTPVVVSAQTASITELFPILSGVDLTVQQKIQLAELGSQASTQFQSIVTPEQRSQFRAALAEGKGFPEAFAAMNVTPEQRTQLQGVFRSAQTQLVSTFTTEQRQQILENVRSLLQLPPTP